MHSSTRLGLELLLGRCLFFVASILFHDLSYAHGLNFIEAHTLRLSSSESLEEWVLFHDRPPSSESTHFKSRSIFVSHGALFRLFNAADSGDSTRVRGELESNMGTPYVANASIGIAGSYRGIWQSFSVNAGTIFQPNNPVFPELRGVLFNDFLFTTSYGVRVTPRLRLKPKITYGSRRLLFPTYDIGDLVENQPIVKIQEVPYLPVVEVGTLASVDLTRELHSSIHFSVQGVSLIQNRPSYWEARIGVHSKNLAVLWSGGLVDTLKLKLSLAPFFGGNYDWDRTLQLGLQVGFSELFNLDLFLWDRYRLGAFLRFKLRPIEVHFFTMERVLDNFGQYPTRQYGGGLSLYF